MITTRTRSGFFFPSPEGVSVWAAYAGTSEDFLLTMSTEQLEAALRRAEHHIKKNTNSYGLGVVKELDESEQLYALEAVYNGMLIIPVFNRLMIQTLVKRNSTETEATNQQLYATKEGEG